MKVKRSNIQITANDKRVIINFLDLAVNTNNTSRVNRLLDTVLSIPENELETLYERIKKSFASRHRNFEHYLKINFDKVQSELPGDVIISEIRSLIIGAYFSKEYSVQSAALFNPSIVAHPDQNGLEEGEKRFVLSLRAVGEGHISSIEFRSGIVDKDGTINLDKETGFLSCSDKDLSKVYSTKGIIKNTTVLNDFDQSIMNAFEETFTLDDYLEKVRVNEFSNFDKATQTELFQILDTNYDV